MNESNINQNIFFVHFAIQQQPQQPRRHPDFAKEPPYPAGAPFGQRPQAYG